MRKLSDKLFTQKPQPAPPLLIQMSEPRRFEANIPEQKAQTTTPTRSGFIIQAKAIFKKNFAQQRKQSGTNLCQILTPIFCLVFVYMIKIIIASKLPPKHFDPSIPFMFNVPYRDIYEPKGALVDPELFRLDFPSCLQYYLLDFDKSASEMTREFVNDPEQGILNNRFPPVEFIKKRYRCAVFKREMPYFISPENGTINQQIYGNLQYLDKLKENAVNSVRVLPDGAVTFYEANKNNLTMNIQINDVRIPSYHRGNGVTRYTAVLPERQYTKVLHIHDGQLILADLMTKSFIQTMRKDVYSMSGSTAMPNTATLAELVAQIISLTGGSLYPLALSLLMPIFMHGIVLEKEEKLREIMKMNGLKMRNYWITNYLWSLMLYLITLAVFLFVGRYALTSDFFTDTSFSVLACTLFGWGLSQVSLAFFYQNFFSKAKTAIILGYILSIWTTLLGVTNNTITYPLPQKLPFIFRQFPPFAMSRLIYNFSKKCSIGECITSFNEFNDEMWSCFQTLYVMSGVILIFGLYLDSVLPSEYGIKKHPLFCLFSNKKELHQEWEEALTQLSFGEKNKHKPLVSKDEDEENPEDEDVRKEREFINSVSLQSNQHPLLIKNLRKVYKAVGGKPPKVAVDNFSLHIRKGEIFGLLGPNGAGKTSLISMLTGLYPPEGGNAWVGGHDIVHNIDAVHTQMGVCPQFDLMWPELTVREHLEFYARIRGVSSHEENNLVNKTLREVYLTKFADFQTKQLSGGMRRRLSVAIALVGDPKIIFLDEPTTGLDPENRRQLWDILAEAKGKKSMVLTTHSMEEADVLCNRIGIITDGKLRCLGTQARLKAKFGSGYHLFINCHKDYSWSHDHSRQHQSDEFEESAWVQLQRFVEKLLPNAILKSSFNGCFVYLVPFKGLEISKLFDTFEANKEALQISDWGISQATLEDVFMEIVEKTAYDTLNRTSDC